MSYLKYYRLRKYVNGEPSDEYKPSDARYDSKVYDTLLECEGKGKYYNEYFTIEALEDGKIEVEDQQVFYGNVFYSKNGGEWFEMFDSAINVYEGDRVRLKKTYFGNPSWASASQHMFQVLPKCRIYGNINSLFQGDDFKEKIETEDYMFSYYFFNTKVVDASGLVLPYEEASQYMCNYMFSQCELLEKAPELNAKVLKSMCYRNMFSYCSSLKSIKCLAEEGISSSSSVASWCDYVPEGGTFIKKKGVDWPSGGSGIPDGWTVEEE